MSVWITSDLHIGHINIVKWRDWSGGSIESHTDVLRDAWNAKVKPNDQVYIIGDLVMGKRAETLPIIKTFNGTKFLIPGNHDHIHPGQRHGSPEKAANIHAMYADVVLKCTPLEFSAPGSYLGKYIMCHFPWYGTPDHAESDREYLDKWYPHREDHPGAVLLHGHTHQQTIVGDHSVHVGVDAAPDHAPFHLDEVCDLIEQARSFT